MSKENKRDIISNSEDRRTLLNTERGEFTTLNNEVEVLRGEGQEVGGLIESIRSVFKDIDNAERSIKDDNKFKKTLNKILNKKKEIREEVGKMKTGGKNVKREVEKKDAVGEVVAGLEKKKQEDLRDLRAQAVLENDKEFIIFIDRYFDAEETIDELYSLAAKSVSEESMEKKLSSFTDLSDELKDLKILLQNKNYKDFAEKHTQIKEGIKRLKSEIKPELNKEKPAPEVKKPAVVVKTSEVKSVAAGEIIVAKEKAAETKAEVVVAEPAEPVVAPMPATAEASPAPKKGLWGRFKEAIFHPETKKVAKKVSYDTATSVVGLKFVIDALRWAKNGDGDMAEWWRGKKESKGTKEAITTALQDLLESLEKSKGNKALAEHEKIENRVASFKAKVESANITPEAKQGLLTRLFEIANKHREETATAFKERDKEIQRVLDSYLQAKVTGIKIARDFSNLILTATGLFMARGIVYAGASVAERWGKAKKEFIKQTTQESREKTELGFVAKDVFVNSAIETCRALMGQGDKKGASGTQRAIDFAKALGIVARGFGIYGVAVSSGEPASQSIDKVLAGLKEYHGLGVVVPVSHNFIHNVEHVGQNLERAGHMVTHPTEIFEYKESAMLKPVEHHEIPEHAPSVETHTEVPIAPISAEVPPVFSVDQFSTEHNLSQEFRDSLDKLVSQHPKLNNKDSMDHILNASHVGGDVHSHHEIIKGTIDTLDESGGERRQVIFEELLKKGGPSSATQYLEAQHFSSQHLSHLPAKYIHDGKLDYAKFVQDYNEKDGKMVRGLFGAMQGRESTNLANAHFEGEMADGAKVDNHVHGKISYFGLENKKPVLSGKGEVRVVETNYGPDKITTHENTTGSPAAAQNDGLTTDDKLWANANVIRSMKGGAAYDGNFENAPAAKLSAQEQAVLAEVEADKDKFARLGETHIDILDRTNNRQTVGEYINVRTKAQAGGTDVAPPTIEKTTSTKIIHTYKASEAKPVVETKAVEVKPIPAIVPQAESKPIVSLSKKPLPSFEKNPVVPEEVGEKGTLSQVLAAHGRNKEEFTGIFQKMRENMAVRFGGDSFIYIEGAPKFLDDKIDHILLERQEHYKNALDYGFKLNDSDLAQVDKIIHAEDLFKNGKSGWEESLSKTVFSKEDEKVVQLFFASHKNPALHPILTNNSHAVRIWDSTKKKDVFWYEKDNTFHLDAKGNLVVNEGSNQYTMDKQKVLELAKK